MAIFPLSYFFSELESSTRKMRVQHATISQCQWTWFLCDLIKCEMLKYCSILTIFLKGDNSTLNTAIAVYLHMKYNLTIKLIAIS